jgi:hypothetical protein
VPPAHQQPHEQDGDAHDGEELDQSEEEMID